MNRVCFLLLLCCLSSCKMNKTERVEMPEDSVDTVGLDRRLQEKSVSDSLKIGLVDDGDCLQKQLLAIHDELRKRLENTTYTHIRRNVTGYGVGMHCIDIDLIVNTPEKRKEFREEIMDSPVFCFHGVEVPVINERVGRNHIRGIHIRPEYPVFSTKAPHATFILSNHSGGDLTCGEERVMKASLYPDVHPNKPGRYRYFYEITIRRKPVLMMAEFRLTDNEEEWRTAEKTSLPPYISDAGKGGSPQLITEEPMEEPVYKVVEVMPEFPGGMKALMDFIQKNIRYPEEARKNGIQGRVAVSVVIDENGRVTDPVIMRSRYPALDEEALRIVGLMPQWKPGMQQGKAVKVEFTFPVTFKLE